MDQNHGARDLGKMAGIVFMFFCSMTLVAEFGLASASRQQHPMAQSKTYIVHVRQPVKGIASSKMDRESCNVIDGFAARLTSAEVESMTTKDGFLHAYVDQVIPLQTTRTPRFLGLSPEQGLWHDTRLGSGTIIGVLDGGIWPEHPSLNDTGMPPPPKKWKGWCVDAGQDFNSSHCNNKLIGAQVFSKGAHSAMPNNITDSPRDQDGHGTHTATTAAGSLWVGQGSKIPLGALQQEWPHSRI
ncbi:hypothetical protein AMTR_s00044p00139080 [Amborella trichopoda]|uniref:Peptidase S8/S53 domain-containing protein n=1 Tax=Amborella trichopoda TaxID=13333 RepID=U5D6X4_AMBTC|nr:hypothetical protein AMTR_s00044p00139080 [Amborella trichopoda]